MLPTMAQVARISQSAQVSKPFSITQFRISHSRQCPNFTPGSMHPVQLIISGEISGELNNSLHFSAVLIRSSVSFVIVATLASQVTQSNPQQATSFFIFKSYYLPEFSTIKVMISGPTASNIV